MACKIMDIPSSFFDYMNNVEILNFLINNGNIDLSNIQEQIDMKKNEQILENHPFKIWQGSNGKWYTYVKDEGEKRKLVKKSSEDILNKFLISYYKEKELNPTIDEIFWAWNNRRREYKEISDNSYDRMVCTFNRHFDDFKNYKIKDITSKEIVDFLRYENADKDLASKAYTSLKSIIKGVLEYSLENGFISDDEYVKMITRISNLKLKHTKTIKNEEDEIFNEYETQTLFNHFTKDITNRRNLGLLLMMVTGMRVGEVAALKFEDVDLTTIKVRRTETKRRTEEKNPSGRYKHEYYVKDYPKTKDSVRTIVVPNNALFILKEINRLKSFSSSEYIFTDEKGNRMNTTRFLRRLYTSCSQCGLKKKSCHKFRKTYVSILLDNNVDYNFIKQQVGHADISTSESFYHKNRKSLEKKASIISSISEFSNLKLAE